MRLVIVMILSAILGGYLYYKIYNAKIASNTFSYNFDNHINAVQ